MGSQEQPNNQAKTIVGAAVVLSVGILLSRILGFAREAVIAFLHGATSNTDAYYAAFALPELMSYFLAGGTLSITFIPLFTAYIARDDEEGGWRLFSTVTTTMVSALLVVTLLMEILAPSLVPLLVPGFADNPEQLELTIRMTRIVIPAQLCFYVGGLLNATLFVRKVFWPAAVAPLIYNICIIVGGVGLAPWIGIEGFAVGALAGAALGPFAIPLYAARHRVRFSFRFAPLDPGFIEFMKLMAPLMLGVGLVTVDQWLLNFFASSHEHGSIAWLNNSRKLMLVVFAIIGQAAGQAALPFLAELHHAGKAKEMAEMLSRNVGRVVFLAAVGAAALAVSADSSVFVVFRRGAFTAADAEMTSTLLMCFCIGLAAWAAQTMAVRGFYARKDMLTPMLVSTAVVGLAVPLYYLLDRKLGLVGLPIASSMGMTLNAIATISVYRLQTKNLPLRPISGGLFRGLVVAACCGAAAFGTGLLYRGFIEANDFFSHLGLLVSQGGGFAIVLALLAVIWRPPELAFVVDRVAARLRR